MDLKEALTAAKFFVLNAQLDDTKRQALSTLLTATPIESGLVQDWCRSFLGDVTVRLGKVDPDDLTAPKPNASPKPHNANPDLPKKQRELAEKLDELLKEIANGSST